MSPRPSGELALVLHTHLPWLKGHGGWPVGEEWLFQAWGESWLPVTDLLLRLAEDGHRDVLTLGVTPLVAHQVADRRLADDLGTWLGGQMWRAEEQRSLHGWMGPGVDLLGPFYWRHYADLLALHQRIEAAGGLLTVWADLADRGVIELLGGPATHPYLPLMRSPGLIDAQLASGLAHHAGWAGSAPRGLWAPEMGYRPAGQVADAAGRPLRVDRHGTPTLARTGPTLPGLETHYAAHGIDHFLVDAPTLVRAAGGRPRDWTVRPAVPDPADRGVDEVVHDGVLVGDSDVAAYARDLSVAYHVWSPAAGYPGNEWYRDYYARGTFGVHPSWRVTDKDLAPDQKAIYEPAAAAARTRVDADHLHGVLHEVLAPRPGKLVVAAYDTELFGHWWFEGVAWLEHLLRAVADDPRLRTTTLASRRERCPPTRRLALPESSWGFAKGHASWVTDQTREMWQELATAERDVRAVLAAAGRDGSDRSGADHDAPTTDLEARLQLARELALLAGSDWPFMVTRGNSADYAWERFRGHRERIATLCDMLGRGAVDPERVRSMAALDAAPSDAGDLLDSLIQR